MIALLFFIISPILCLQPSECYNRFPLRDTVTTVKTLVRMFGVPSHDIDETHTEWINLLIPEEPEGFQLGGITYFFSDNSLPPEQTFYFNQLHFLPVPAYVVPKERISTWKSAAPDNTYLLSKISFTCPSGQRVCGLRCCPEANYAVQEMFVEKKKLTKNTTVNFRDVTYSFVDRNNSCDYTFSYYDTKMRSILGVYEATVYFDCPSGQTCCGLYCSSPPKTELSVSRVTATAQHSLAEMRTTFLAGGCIVSMAVFVTINIITCRRRYQAPQMVAAPLATQRDSQETQTTPLQADIPLLA